MDFGKTENKRRELLESFADYVLAHGLHQANLRALAAAAGTSDRMLLHYFRDKDEIMEATLGLISQRLVAMLDTTRPDPMASDALLTHLAAMLKDPFVRPYTRLWLELAAQVAGGDTNAQPIGKKIGQDFLSWIAAGLVVEKGTNHASAAALALVTLEGMVLLDALGLDNELAAALRGLRGRNLVKKRERRLK